MRLSELPEDTLPREKLIKRGRATLTDAELVALFLRTGVRGRNVLDIAGDMIAKASGIENLAQMDAQEMVKLAKGVGLAKASTLAAAFELGGRALSAHAKRKPLGSPILIYQFLQPYMQWETQEKIYVLLVDVKLRLITFKEVSVGTLNETLAHPREILRPAIVHNAYGFILAHNHPSGDPRPSDADHRLTETIKEAAAVFDIPLVDHIIVGKPSSRHAKAFYSYKESNLL